MIGKLLVNDVNNLSINKLEVMRISSRFTVDYNINKKFLFEILYNKKILYGNTSIISCRYYLSFIHIAIKPSLCIFIYNDGNFIIKANNHDRMIELYTYIALYS